MSHTKQLEEFQKRLNAEVAEIREIQTKMMKINGVKSNLGAQQNENEMVKEELKLMEPDARVYKLIGRVLVQQDKVDAAAIVDKRLEYITAESSRQDKLMKELEEKQEHRRKTIGDIQAQAQALAQKGQKA
eukprot:NODE_6593_length_519_cov_23.061224_g6428_i0.p2 GENE.NODE_6593_length_519_cov_23.061224_g6428_i0~~NODE_6593_length_519_cov_23.061224_g6428_i0.p2  ORF type:complete len:131 (-),score=45.34 NODE_6593_length_519_cov_23.061224_g6428_i0:111-503(-)